MFLTDLELKVLCSVLGSVLAELASRWVRAAMAKRVAGIVQEIRR